MCSLYLDYRNKPDCFPQKQEWHPKCIPTKTKPSSVSFFFIIVLHVVQGYMNS